MFHSRSTERSIHIDIDNLYYLPNYSADFVYIINNIVYDATELNALAFDENEIQEILSSEVPILFHINLNGSNPIAVTFSGDFENVMLYQQLNDQLIELTSRGEYGTITSAQILSVPSPGAEPEDDTFPALNLPNPDPTIINRIMGLENTQFPDGITEEVFDAILNIIPIQQPSVQTIQQRQLIIPEIPQSIQQVQSTQQRSEETPQYIILNNSYETLIKQLYGIPVEFPEYLIVNGLRVNFMASSRGGDATSFQQIIQMLQNNQIERYILNSSL